MIIFDNNMMYLLLQFILLSHNCQLDIRVVFAFDKHSQLTIVCNLWMSRCCHTYFDVVKVFVQLNYLCKFLFTFNSTYVLFKMSRLKYVILNNCMHYITILHLKNKLQTSRICIMYIFLYVFPERFLIFIVIA